MSIINTTLTKLGIGSNNNEDAADGEKTSIDSEGSDTSEPSNFFAPEDAIWYKDKVVVNGKHARTYAIDAWPPAPRRNMFQEILMDANIDYDFALHYEPYNNSVAIDKLDEIEDELEDKRTGEFARFIPDKGALEETEKVVNVMKRYINEGETMFDVSFFITVYADNQEELENVHKRITDDLVRGANVSVTKNTLRQKEAMQSASPAGKNILGNDRDALQQKMLGSAAAQTYPFIQDTFMEEGGVMFGVNEESMTPVIIDVFARRNGYNMITSGMIGAGKSFSSSQVLLSMDAAYQDFQQFIIDPMGGFQGVNYALDGKRIVLNGQECLNPMAIEPTPQHVIEESDGQVNPWSEKKQSLKWFFTQFFESVGSSGDSLSNKELSMLDRAITKTYHKKGITEDIDTHSKENPTIMDLIETLEDMVENTDKFTSTNEAEEKQRRKQIATSLLIALDPFKPGGEFHNLAQKTEIDISGERTMYLDLSQIPENSDDLGIMMKLLFMKIYQEAKTTDNKVALTIDESHKIMRDDGITGGLEEMFRHSRHFDLSINLISQTPEEFYSTETAQTIAKQCTIKRFHRVDKINEDVAKDVLNMNDEEINYIENAEMGEGDKDYSQALLRISDEDRSIPLQIYATKDEAMVIDYDSDEDIDEYTDPAARDLKRALDTKNQAEIPTIAGDATELTQQVRSSIAMKEENRKDIVKEEILREHAGETRSEDEEESVVKTSEPTLADPGETSDADNVDAIDELRNRLGDSDSVDNRRDKEITMIATQYNIGDDSDSIDTLRKKIKRDVFGANVTIETDTGLDDPEDISTTINTDDADTGEERVETNDTTPTPGEQEQEPVSDSDTTTEDETGGTGSDDENNDTDSDSANGGVADVEAVGEYDDATVETMYLQHIGGGDALTTEEKREKLKDEFSD